jgi:hypothetical protein
MAVSGRFFPVQTLHLGPTGTVAGCNISSLLLPGQLGMVVEIAGKVYRLVQFDNGAGNVASAATMAAHWHTRASFIVTSDKSSGEMASNGIAGGFLGVLTDQYYGFIQIGGLQTLLTNGSANAAGDLLAGSTGDNDGTLVIVAAATQLPVAVCQAGDGGGTTNAAYWLLGTTL